MALLKPRLAARGLATRMPDTPDQPPQRPIVTQLLDAIRRTPWWRGDDVVGSRALFEELMERGNARCPHLGRTHEATTLNDGSVRITPKDGVAAATVFFVHGGGFFAGSPGAYKGAVAALLSRVPGGCSAVLPKYRLAPEATIEDAIDDVVKAYEELAAEGGPIVLAGDSAGAYLALRAAERLATPAASVPPTGVTPTDVPPTGVTPTGVPPAGVLLWCPYLLHHPRLDLERTITSEGDFLDAAALQPARHVLDEANDAAHAFALMATGCPDVLILSGERETLHVDALTLAITAKASGVEVTHETYPQMFHDFMLFPKFLKEGADALDASAAYIATQCSGGDDEEKDQSDVRRLKKELADALKRQESDPVDAAVEAAAEGDAADEIARWTRPLSRYVGVSWNEQRGKWQARYSDATGKQRSCGQFECDEAAARARDRAILTAGLENERRMNACDATGALMDKPPGYYNPRPEHDDAAVRPPDPARAPQAKTSHFVGVHWDRSLNRWRGTIGDARDKRRTLGRFDTEEAAAYAVNAAIKLLPPDVQLKRSLNPVVDGQLVPKPEFKPTQAVPMFYGVRWERQAKKWRAYYTGVDGRSTYIGLYATQEEGARAYNAAIADAGLASKRRLNSVDAATGALVEKSSAAVA